MRDLTEEQERAVARRAESLLLAAGAGTGKTSVLVERFVRAVREDGVAPARILAITFTDRAAAELRERVRERLMALGDREAARDTETAYVSTVHAFCARLLRAHALALGLDPGFTVLDEPRAARLRAVAFQRALAALLAGPQRTAVIDLAAAYGADRLQTTVVAAHETLRSRGQRAPALPALGPRSDAVEVGEAAAGRGPADGRGAAAGAELALAATELARVARLAAGELDVEHARRPGRRIEGALGILERASTLLEAPEPLTLEPGAGPPPPGVIGALELPAANGALAGPACQAYRRALAAFAGACADHHAGRALVLLGGLLDGYTAAYANLKRTLSAVDFDDLEIEARDLLERDGGARRSWAERFGLIMVDEFQDTNPRQLAILRCLDRENLFTVGDEFQSIYGFRHADVNLFRSRRRELATRGASLALSRNFRARQPLLEVINAVFSPRFGEDFTPLVAGRVEERAEAGEPLVELLVTDSRGWDDEGAPDPGDSLPPAPRWRQAEARLLAQQIADLVAAGQAGAGDVAVLVRATGDIPVYERALEDRGLATLAAGAGGYWSHQQVNDLLAYLGALANPMDERALYATLASPLVGVSSDGLALLSRAARAAGDGPWATLEQAFGDDPPRRDDPQAGETDVSGLATSLAEADRQRLAQFRLWLAAERRAAARHAISELLERAIASSRYEEFVLGLRWGARRLANVHKLLRLARTFEATEGRDLRAFLDHASRQAGAQAREGEAPIEDAELDAVRLMTIHAAKGLEFGVVAVADLGRQGRTDVPDLLVDGERVGLRLLTLDGAGPTPALAFEDLRRERLEAETREEERVLYVAMTRARERLLLSGAVNLERWPAGRPGMPAIGWLGPALAEGIRDRLDSEQPVIDLSPPGAPQARVRCRLNAPDTIGKVLREPSLRGLASADVTTPGSVDPTVAAPATQRADPEEQLVDISLNNASEARPDLRARPPDPPGAASPAPLPDTISYTALAEFERCGYRYYLERVLGLPPIDAPAARGRAADGALEGRLRGTLVHRLLESLDYASPRPPDPGEVDRVARELGASPDARERRQIAELVAAVAGTELGARLAGAARVHREHPFAFALGPCEPLLTGVVDAIAHELDGTSLIVDYKSDRVGREDLASLTEHAYGIQRRIYALAALRAGALEVEVVHWFLERPSEPVRARYLAADAGELADGLRARMGDLRAGSFRVTASPHRELCLTCPGRRGLCSWSESETLRPASATELA